MKLKTAKKGVYYRHFDFPDTLYLGQSDGNLIIVKWGEIHHLRIRVSISDFKSKEFWTKFYVDPDQPIVKTKSQKWILTYSGTIPKTDVDIFWEFRFSTRKMLRITKKITDDHLFGTNTKKPHDFTVIISKKI